VEGTKFYGYRGMKSFNGSSSFHLVLFGLVGQFGKLNGAKFIDLYKLTSTMRIEEEFKDSLPSNTLLFS
jgi:hypothetical protein